MTRYTLSCRKGTEFWRELRTLDGRLALWMETPEEGRLIARWLLRTGQADQCELIDAEGGLVTAAHRTPAGEIVWESQLSLLRRYPVGSWVHLWRRWWRENVVLGGRLR